jgi:hypothetical protein
MRHVKLFGLCLAVALAMCAIAVASSSAAVPGFEFSGKSDTFSSKGGALKLETTAGEEVKCETTTATGEVEGSSGSNKVRDVLPIFKGCTAKIVLTTYECQSAGAAKEEIKGFGLQGKLGYLDKVENKVGILFNPETGKAGNPYNLFAEFECTHASEKVKVKVKGAIIALVTPVEKSVAPGEHFSVAFSKGSGKGESLDKKFEGGSENILETETTVSKKFNDSAIEGSIELFPSVSTTITASVAPPETSCPITSEGVTFDTTVTSGNEAALREDVVNSTWIPVAEPGESSGGCKEEVKFSTGVSEGHITKLQKEEYEAKVKELVVPGDIIYIFKWHQTGGSSFETYGVFNSSGEGEFESISSWDTSKITDSAPESESMAGEWVWGPLVVRQGTEFFDSLGYESKVTLKIVYNNMNEITDKTALISFRTGFGWEAAATMTEAIVNVGGVQCYKVIATITYVTGLKSLTVSGGANGFNASVTVNGILGANGQHQEEDRLCVNGTTSRTIG